MENGRYSVSAAELREWLENGEPVFILDLRPMDQRQEWQIPGSFHLDAYKPLNEGDSSILNDIGLPKNRKVVTVCAGGRISQTAAVVLRENGFDAYSLEGGMKAWSTAWNLARREFENFEIIQLRRTGKGCLSYLVSSNHESVIIDASLPVEVYEKVIKENGLTPKYIIETHIHADHLSRS
jgi:rhodanese-related sulfurtransferase